MYMHHVSENIPVFCASICLSCQHNSARADSARAHACTVATTVNENMPTGTCFSHAHKRIHVMPHMVAQLHVLRVHIPVLAPPNMRARTHAYMFNVDAYTYYRGACTCICARKQTRRSTSAHVHAHAFMSLRTCMCLRANTRVCEHIHASRRAHIHASAFVFARTYPCVCTGKCMVVHSHTRVLHQHKRITADMRTCSCAHNSCMSNRGQGVHMHQCTHGACL